MTELELQIYELKNKIEIQQNKIELQQDEIDRLRKQLDSCKQLLNEKIDRSEKYLNDEIKYRFELSQKEQQILGRDFMGWARLFGVIAMGLGTSLFTTIVFREIYQLIFGG